MRWTTKSSSNGAAELKRDCPGEPRVRGRSGCMPHFKLYPFRNTKSMILNHNQALHPSNMKARRLSSVARRTSHAARASSFPSASAVASECQGCGAFPRSFSPTALSMISDAMPGSGSDSKHPASVSVRSALLSRLTRSACTRAHRNAPFDVPNGPKARTKFAVRRNGTVSGTASDQPLSKQTL